MNSAIIEKNKYYFFCCAGLGDTMLVCGFLHALKRKYGFPIILLLKKSHEEVVKMYNIKEYLLIGVDIDIITLEKNMKKIPTLGKVFAAHPCKHPELRSFFNPIFYQTSTIRFLPWFRNFLGIYENDLFLPPKIYPSIDEEVRNFCKQIAPISDIVILSPEATSVRLLPNEFWENLTKQLKKKGLCVISNVINPYNAIRGTKFVRLSVKQLLTIAMECHSFYSVRSGICDLLFFLGQKLHVFYPSHSSLYIYSLNAMFGTEEIDEKILIDTYPEK